MMSTKKLQRMIICTYIGMMIVFIIIVYNFYSYMRESISENIIANQEEVTKQISEQIDNYIKDMDDIALQVMGNDVLLDGFAQTDQNMTSNWFDKQIILKNRIQNALTKISGPSDRVERICVYNDKQDYISYGVVYEKENRVSESLEQIEVLKLIKEISLAPYSKRKIEIHTDYWGKEEDVISVFRVLVDATTGNQYGIVEVQRPMERLLDETFLEHDENMEVIIFDASGNLVLSTEMASKREIDIEIDSAKSGKGQDISTLLTWDTGEEYGWRVVVMQSKGIFWPPMKEFRNVLVIAIMLFSIISIVFFIIIIIIKKCCYQLRA